jgi:pimeloyl-ACP methyl ester carboxylesterase
MPTVDAGGLTLAIHRWGDPASPGVLFWHALGNDATGRDLEPIAGRLVASGYRVIAVDGPGFGASPLVDAEHYRLDVLAEAFGAVVRHEGAAPVVAMGHSWGGAIAVLYAAAHPDEVRALVLLDSGHIDYMDLADVSEHSAEEWVEQVRQHDGERPEARGRAMAGLTARISQAWPVLAEHRIPTLLLLATVPPHGEQNREHVPRFSRAVPHAEVRWLEGVTHSMLGDVGPGLGDDIASWLAGAGAGAP